MPSIELFLRLEIPDKEVFNYISNSHNLLRASSFFYSIENLLSSNSKIDENTSFLQRCVFSELLNLYYKVKEVTDKKIVFDFNGLIKGQECINIINNEGFTILRDKIEFSTFNNFNFPLLDLIMCTIFNLDTFVKHLRLKNSIYNEIPKLSSTKSFSTKDLSVLRSYTTINSYTKDIMYLFEDLSKLALCLPSLLNINLKGKNQNNNIEFSLIPSFPFLPSVQCKVLKKEENKIVFSFSFGPFNGTNTLSFLSNECELLLENKIEINHPHFLSELSWLLLGNTIVKGLINNWNRKFSEIVLKSKILKNPEIDLNNTKALASLES